MSKIHLPQRAAPTGIDMTVVGDRVDNGPLPTNGALVPVSNYCLKLGIWRPQEGSGEEPLDNNESVRYIDLNTPRLVWTQIFVPIAVPFRSFVIYECTGSFEFSFSGTPAADQIYPVQSFLWPNMIPWRREYTGLWIRNGSQPTKYARLVAGWRI